MPDTASEFPEWPETAAFLFRSWLNAAEPDTPFITEQLPVPGVLSLRCRYELLAGGTTVGSEPGRFAISGDVWRSQTDAFDRGDQALRANNPATARAAFTELIRSHNPERHPLPLVDGHIGMGDADRQDERIESALWHYTIALAEARTCQYAYGQVRAAIPLGYLHLRVGSAGEARSEFETAVRIARNHDWRLDHANALTGLGESHQRLRDSIGALRALLEALSIFTVLQSREGVANATLHLGEVCRRAHWLRDAEGWYEQAVEAATDLPVALSNSLDGLGEVHLAMGDLARAIVEHTAAWTAAGSSYPRGRAHASIGLARCAVETRDWQTAINYFSQALRLYEQIDDLTSAATAQSGLARSYHAMGDMPEALRHRLAAVELIETARASQNEHAQQGEYFARFGTAHEMALRTALLANDPAAFIAVFESIAGRRLAGLMAGAAEDPAEAHKLAQVVLQADSRVGRRRRITKALDEIGMRRDDSIAAHDTFNQTVASLYSPFNPADVDALWERVETGDAYVLLAAALQEPAELAWFLKPPIGPLHMGLFDLPEDAANLIESLHAAGLPLDILPTGTAALGSVMPADALAVIEPDAPLIIVPAGKLWGVPWPAIPVSDTEYLGERNPLSIAPSLTAVAHACGGLREPVGSPIAYWTSPQVDQHRLIIYDDTSSSAVKLQDADACRGAIINAEHDFIVVLSHGRPVGDLVHYLELDEHVSLTPADLLRADPPPALALIACWGAHAPAQGWGDPLSIATLALARGSSRIVATTSELLDDGASSAFVNMFLHYSQEQSMPKALQLATRRWLSRPEYRNGYLSRWAPLIAVGAW